MPIGEKWCLKFRYPRPLPAVPTFDTATESALGSFKAALVRMGGKFADALDDGNLDALIRGCFPTPRSFARPRRSEGQPPRRPNRRPQELDDVGVGVVRAVFGVAETGSVWITEAQFKVNTLGFLSQHLVVLLDPTRILENLHHAYRQRGQFDVGYGVFMTGPSATADIEGVLIHGAQGIRSLTVLPVPA